MADDAPGTAHEDPAVPAAPHVPLALYRKYRPATFAEVKGQEHVTEPLRQALRSGRVNHAYLFSGPRGCGKTSSARILARSLNCEQGPTPDPCGKCASCVALAPSGPGSIDVIEIDAASHGGVDDARDLRERAFYAPVAGRYKIYIIDEAHMVTREGFNALLKLVEEPPPHLKFVFATTEPEKVIPTIRSRTHHYAFRLVPPAVLRGLLEEILAAEGIACEPAVLPLVVRAGAGSVRDSLSVLDQLLAGAGEEGLLYERTAALLGYTDDSLLDAMVDAFASGDGAAVFGTLDAVMEAGHDPRRFATDLLDRLRDLIVLGAVPTAGSSGLLDVPADRLERMTAQVGRLGPAELTRAAQLMSDGLVQMRGTTSPRLLLELTCAQIILPGAHTDEKALLARLDRLERRLDGGDFAPAGPPPREQAGPAPAAPAGSARARTAAPRAEAPRAEAPRAEAPRTEAGGEPAVTRRPAPRGADAAPGSGGAGAPAGPPPARAPLAADGPVDVAMLRRRWPDLVEAVKAERRVAGIVLDWAVVESIDNGMVTIAFPRDGQARGFANSDHPHVVEQVLSQFLGRPARVKAVVNPAVVQSAASAAPSRPARPAPSAGPRPGESRPPTGGMRPAEAAGGTAAGRTGPSASAGARDGGRPADRSAPGPRASAAERPPGAQPGRADPPTPAPARASAFDENEWPDDAGDLDDAGGDHLTGMELIRRQLGGEIIEEIDEG